MRALLRPSVARVRAGVASALALVLFFLSFQTALASSEAAFRKACAQHKATAAYGREHLDRARRERPDGCLELSGLIQGVMRVGSTYSVILKMVDDYSIDLKCAGERPELQTGARVRCLVKPEGRTELAIVDVSWDQTPVQVLMQAAQAALQTPSQGDLEARRAAAEKARREAEAAHPDVSRGGDSTLVIRRAIARFNPRLPSGELDRWSASIVRYCNQYGLCSLDDQLLVVSVIAAESHFNPRARSPKGATGLGQLMPSVAASHGVDPTDPVQNLEAAIHIICDNLNRYQGQRDQQWLLALAAYNAGNGAVKRHGGVPPYRETRDYLWRIYNYWCELTGRQAVPRR